jgi:hypothetical protein
MVEGDDAVDSGSWRGWHWLRHCLCWEEPLVGTGGDRFVGGWLWLMVLCRLFGCRSCRSAVVLWRRRWRRFGVIYRWRGEWPSVGESVAVGLGVTGDEAEFPIGVDEQWMLNNELFLWWTMTILISAAVCCGQDEQCFPLFFFNQNSRVFFNSEQFSNLFLDQTGSRV